jgi:hypothetical protein
VAVLTVAAVASCGLTLGYLFAGWRNWLRLSGGPWWRRTVLTRREDLRVGATFMSSVATAIWLACWAAADHVRDGYPASRAVTGTVLHSSGTGVAVAVPVAGHPAHTRVAVINNLISDVGDRIRVFPSGRGFRVEPSLGALEAPLIFAGVLSLVAAGAFVWSLLPTAGRRLVMYRD